MTEDPIAAIVLAAGQGTRMKSALPKILHPLAGRPMILYLMETLAALPVGRTVVVVGPEMDAVSRLVAPNPTVHQLERLGTGHAVAQAKGLLKDATWTVLVVYGDSPLISVGTLQALLGCRRRPPYPAVVALGFRPRDGGEYGRLLVEQGQLQAIVEYKDATPAERAVTLCNSGVLAIEARHLWGLLDRLGNDNAKGEYYLTDLVGLAVADGLGVGYVEAEPDELVGVNSRAELAAAERVLQDRLRARAMANGATLLDPGSVYFSWDTELGQDVTVGPQVVFGPGVTVGDAATIRPFCHLEGVRVADSAMVGPFARLRPGAEIGAGAHIGNFVEVKNAEIGAGAKVNHLSYVGDAKIGANANIGAGTITCNYDGFGKYLTEIGAGAFIGSNTALVAPVTVGAQSIVAAGSVITKDVAEGALAVARGHQMELPGWADRFRARKQAERDGDPDERG